MIGRNATCEYCPADMPICTGVIERERERETNSTGVKRSVPYGSGVGENLGKFSTKLFTGKNKKRIRDAVPSKTKIKTKNLFKFVLFYFILLKVLEVFLLACLRFGNRACIKTARARLYVLEYNLGINIKRAKANKTHPGMEDSHQVVRPIVKSAESIQFKTIKEIQFP